MGIHNNYKREYQRALFCYTISTIIINSFDILTTIYEVIYFNKKINTKMLFYDFLGSTISTTMSTSFILLIYSAYKRFVVLNLLLR